MRNEEIASGKQDAEGSHVQRIVGRLVKDPSLRAAFEADPHSIGRSLGIEIPERDVVRIREILAKVRAAKDDRDVERLLGGASEMISAMP